MSDGQDRLEDLARHIRVRRSELGLSAEAAAEAAGVSAPTWTRAEKGARVQAATYRGVERALSWPSGRVDEILSRRLETRDKVVVSDSATMTVHRAPHLPGMEAMDDPLVFRILAIPDDELPAEDKVDLIHAVLKSRSAAIQAADRASDAAITARVAAWKRWRDRLGKDS